MRSRISAFFATMSLLLVGLVVQAPPASAYTSLCAGVDYNVCISAGFTAHGYNDPTANGTMYWTMYSGHNCTNYAAYMAIQNGASKPSHNLGSAKDWATNAAASGVTVNSTPAPGAIAQYNVNVYPALAYGHVAYVESVAKDSAGNVTSITISEDNYGGKFEWKKITAGGSGWPSNFIHFADLPETAAAPPQNLQAPSAITDPATGRNIFYVGADNAIWQWSVIGGGWSNVRLGGPTGGAAVAPGTSPSAVVDPSSGRNVFYVGADNAIWQWSVQNNAWVNTRLGGSVAPNTSPSVVTDSSSGRNIFYVGSDSQIWQFSVQNNQWVNFKLTGTGGNNAAAAGTSPSAVVDSSSGRNVFYTGADNAIYQWSIQNNQWHNLKLPDSGGVQTVAPGTSPSAISDSATGRNVFYVGADSRIWQWSIQNGQWNDFQISGPNGAQTVAPGTSPSAVVDPATGRNVFYVGPDNLMWQWSVQSNSWYNNKLTGTGGNVAALPRTSPSAVSDPSSGRNVFYFDNNKMVWQWSVQSNQWVDFKLQ